MNSESKPVFIYGIASINSNSTIPELISFTRSAFRPSDFDMVEQILTARVSNMKTSLEEMSNEMNNWKSKYDLMEKKHGEAVLVNLEMEDKLEKYKREVESLPKVEREKNEMILRLNDEITELKCLKSRADSEIEAGKKRFKELEQRVLRLEDDIGVLVSEVPLSVMKMESDLKGERPVRDEHETEEKEICGDEKLGNDNPKLVEPQTKRHWIEKIHTSPGAGSTSSSPVLEQNGLKEADLHSFDEAHGNGWAIRKQLVSESGSSDKIMGSSMARSGRPQFENIIEIDDSDDEKLVGNGTKSISNVAASDFILGEDKERSCMEKSLPASMHKRKLSSQRVCVGDDDDDSTPIGKRRMKQELEHEIKPSSVNHCFATPDLCSDVAHMGPTSSHKSVFIRCCDERPEGKHNLQVVSSNSDSDDGSDSEDENYSDSCIENMIADLRRRKEIRAWTFEVDMWKTFERDDELCMNAVCALYRQRNSKGKSAKDPVSSKNRGFNTVDAVRATALAEQLIDGDPQGKLKKSVSELQRNDPKVIDECRKLALWYSKQLFEIYQEEEDPFFPCPK